MDKTIYVNYQGTKGKLLLPPLKSQEEMVDLIFKEIPIWCLINKKIIDIDFYWGYVWIQYAIPDDKKLTFTISLSQYQKLIEYIEEQL